MTEAASKTIGVTGEPKAKETKRAKSCSWRVRKDTIADSYTLAVDYFPELGLKDLVAGSSPTPVEVGSHKAVQAIGADNIGCAVTIELTATSRIDVAAAGGDPAKLCAPALAAAKLIEPELP